MIIYLLGRIDTEANPPVIVDVGLYGEKSPTTSLRYLFVELATKKGSGTFGELRESLFQELRESPQFNCILTLYGL